MRDMAMTLPRLCAALLALSVLLAAPLRAQPVPADGAVVVGVRSGDHAGFGRVVLDLTPGMRPGVAREADTVTVRIDGPGGPVAAEDGTRPPRNVRSLAVRDGQLLITLAPGAKLRSYRIGTRLVLDIADPELAAAAAVSKPAAAVVAPPARASVPRPAAATPARPPAPPVVSVDPGRGQSADSRHRARETIQAPAAIPAAITPVAPAAITPVAPAAITPVTPSPTAVPLAPVEAAPLAPLGLSATLVSVDPAAPVPEAAITLPFGAATGAAALRRGDAGLVVFDERRPVDLSALRADPVFGEASITLLPDATMLRLVLPADRQIRLSRADSGWTVAIEAEDAPATAPPIRAEAREGRLHLRATAPGKVVAVPDPLTGATLLIGTQRGLGQGVGGQGVPVDRRSPEFALLATWQGVAVQPLTDALVLRPHPEGFLLGAGANRALSLSAPESQILAMTAAATASRRFDLPSLPTEALLRRLQSARLAAAAAPAQARTGRRREIAEAMLALGMGSEMQAVLSAITTEDARAAEDPDIAALSAIAALLAGRTGQSAAIDDVRLDGTDEVTFWRAVRAARIQPGAPRAAAIFGSAMPLLLSYPALLRDRLLPLALETMVRGGEAVAAKAVLDRLPGRGTLDLARAMVAERAGDTAAALALYDGVAGGTDRFARAQAARAAVELRLASGTLGPAAAADALEKLVYAWRGDGIETDTRLRVAELRAQSGAWRTALALLREMRGLFPEDADAADRALTGIFARSLAPEAQEKLSPLDLVALAEENADLLPSGPAGYALAVRLADRLMALDLPGRAMPVLEKLVDQAPPGIARASIGTSLASVRLDQGAPEAALAALTASVVEGALPPDLLERRTLIFARAAGATGDLPTAIAALGELGTPAALVLRVSLLEAAKDWPAASAALSALARTTLPAEGPFDAAQSGLVLRMAAAAAQAGDERALAGLRVRLAPRLAADQQRDLASLLAAAPVLGVADLPRAGQEALLARSATAAPRGVASLPAR